MDKGRAIATGTKEELKNMIRRREPEFAENSAELTLNDVLFCIFVY